MFGVDGVTLNLAQDAWQLITAPGTYTFVNALGPGKGIVLIGWIGQFQTTANNPPPTTIQWASTGGPLTPAWRMDLTKGLFIVASTGVTALARCPINAPLQAIVVGGPTPSEPLAVKINYDFYRT